MTVGELIERLSEFDPGLEVADDLFLPIDVVEKRTWVDSNYPYDRPDRDYVVLA